MERSKDFKLLVNNLMNAAVYLINPKGYYTFAGGDELRKHGYKENDVVGNHYDIIYQDFDERLYEIFKNSIEKAIQGNPSQFNHYYQHNAFLQTFIPILDEVTGKVNRVLQISQNLYKSEEHSEIIGTMETMEILGLYTMYVDEGIFRCSDALKNILGLESNEIMAEEYLKCVHPDDLELSNGIALAAVEKNESFAMDYRLKRPIDGKWIHVTTRGYVTEEGDGKKKFVGFKQDTSEFKNTERLLQSLDEIISHNIKSKVSNLKMLFDYSDVKIEAIEDDEIRELLTMVKQTAKDLYKEIYDYRKMDGNDDYIL